MGTCQKLWLIDSIEPQYSTSVDLIESTKSRSPWPLRQVLSLYPLVSFYRHVLRVSLHAQIILVTFTHLSIKLSESNIFLSNFAFPFKCDLTKLTKTQPKRNVSVFSFFNLIRQGYQRNKHYLLLSDRKKVVRLFSQWNLLIAVSVFHMTAGVRHKSTSQQG